MKTETTEQASPELVDAAGKPLPFWFAMQGAPSCSKWSKYEIELVAWAAVVAMAATGNTWRRMTSAECWEALGPDQRHHVRSYLAPGNRELFEDWWDMIQNQLVDADHAFEVGGLAWNEFQFRKNMGAVAKTP